MIEEGAYRYVSWPSWPMLLLSVPCRLTLDSLSVVTLPLVHMMPSHPPPQGSPEFQLNG